MRRLPGLAECVPVFINACSGEGFQCAGLPEGLVRRASALSARLEAGQSMGPSAMGALLSHVRQRLADGAAAGTAFKRLQDEGRALLQAAGMGSACAPSSVGL